MEVTCFEAIGDNLGLKTEWFDRHEFVDFASPNIHPYFVFYA